MNLIKKYILCVTAVLCCTGTAWGVMTAQNRTRQLRFDENAVQVFLSQNNTLEDSLGNAWLDFESIKKGGERILSLSPPPVGTVYWIVKAVIPTLIPKGDG